MTKLTAYDIKKMKNNESKITMLTAYDYGMASILDEVGIDMILVGDSMANVFYGQDNTLEVTLDMVINHCQAVAKGAKKHSMVIADMPFGSFGVTFEKTVENAIRIVKQGGAEAVKLEGASQKRLGEIMEIIDVGIPVQGHIGLVPQSANKLGGYKVQGKEGSYFTENELIGQAKNLETVGCFSIILEAITEDVAKKITDSISIPTIGIGAGLHCDGQVLVCYDMLGYLAGYKPKFVKQYATLRDTITEAVKQYADEVKKSKFPSVEYSYHR
jgi:3-methyl-2-oxobutanoate hydroxymethyltransferase